jgi:L-cysteine:1D-myo-inositol 2-amino-2-deoxy-alpha-D-glucopyranoside ligase
MALRLALLASHYRTDREWTEGLLATAVDRLERWRAAAQLPAGPDAGPLLESVRRSLCHDLDTPAAIRSLDDWADAALDGSGNDTEVVDAQAPALFRDIADALLGIAL